MEFSVLFLTDGSEISENGKKILSKCKYSENCEIKSMYYCTNWNWKGKFHSIQYNTYHFLSRTLIKRLNLLKLK